MNDNIKKLAKQSGYQEGFRWAMEDFNLVKFAKLIIQECAEIGDHYDNESTFADGTQDITTAGMEIREHFGVE